MTEFGEIITLQLEDDKTARELLTLAAKHVAAIMRARGWKVPILKELFDKNTRLLGLNHNRGEMISVRVRKTRRGSNFYQYEDILGTLLHELCHIEIGPHNKKFYALYDQLEQECMSTIFYNFSRPLGGKKSICPTNSQLADAAERRRVLNNRPQKLGGGSAGKTMKENILAALEKRL